MKLINKNYDVIINGDSSSGANYNSVQPMTDKEKFDHYMTLPQNEVANMLIEANVIIEIYEAAQKEEKKTTYTLDQFKAEIEYKPNWFERLPLAARLMIYFATGLITGITLTFYFLTA